MDSKNKTKVSKDLKNKKIFITRKFDAPLANVWSAWTDSDLLDHWWAPKPYVTKTKSMDFRVGGRWLYAMIGPDGIPMWGKIDYTSIVIQKNFEAIDSFCDEEGVVNTEFPRTVWKCEFVPSDSGTTVEIETTYETEAALLKIVEMGFEQGFAMAHDNLDEYLKSLI